MENTHNVNEASDARKRANLIKEALKIVDKLGKIDFDDMSAYEKDILVELIDKAKELRKNRLFILK